MTLLSVLVMAIALQPFFEFFQPGNPYQLAAIKQLEDSLPPETLDPNAEWFQVWKQSGLTQKLVVPYFHQLDHPSGRGYRMCFTAAAAMVAAYFGVSDTQEDYSLTRDQFGDTIYVSSQIEALRHLGLEADFRTNGDDALLEAEIASGRPVLVGIFHRGDISQGQVPHCDELGCGHWLVITGFEKDHWIVNDPMGQLDMERGGHFSKYGGKGNKLPRAGFRQRWQADGPGTGWVIVVEE
ncbi:MAG: C39 family peptidase [Gammaproteobacteria bacterium]